jgi:tetratricopeptide (TPR) repeat protein
VLDVYVRQGAAALEANDYATARLCFLQLAREAPERPEFRHNLAYCLERLGQRREAEELFAQLAPDDSQGYAPTHTRQAHRLLKTVPLTPELVRSAEHHLLCSLTGNPDNPEAHALLAKIMVATGRGHLAKEHLLLGVKVDAELSLPLALLHNATGEAVAAKDWADQAARVFQQKTEANVEDDGARLRWAEALLLGGDCQSALKELQRGFELKQAEVYRKPLAVAHAACADILSKQGKITPDDQWALLERGLRLDPKNFHLLRELIVLSHAENAAGAKARQCLERLEGEQKDSATLQFFLGQDAVAHRQFAKAQRYFERTLALVPEYAIAANNLAYLLARNPTPDLDRALNLMHDVLKKYPSNPNYRDTRGQILLMVGKWREAVDDLKQALPALAKNRELHLALGAAYEHLGEKEHAAQHRRLAEMLPEDGGPVTDRRQEPPMPSEEASKK